MPLELIDIYQDIIEEQVITTVVIEYIALVVLPSSEGNTIVIIIVQKQVKVKTFRRKGDFVVSQENTPRHSTRRLSVEQVQRQQEQDIQERCFEVVKCKNKNKFINPIGASRSSAHQ